MGLPRRDTRHTVKAEAAMADTTKCAHPACECTVAKGGEWGKYCSETCKEKGDQTELHCECHHKGCR
jgi:hypothetical protein